MTEIRKHLPTRATIAVTLAAVAAVAVAVTSFWRSFTSIAELAVDYKVPADQAWMIPVAVDGLVVVATVAAAVARHRVARAYSWALLVAGTIVSVAGNGIHAWQLTESPIGVGIAVIPPLVTLAAVHLTILLARQDSDTATAPVCDTGPEPIRATVTNESEQDATPRPVTRLRVASATTPRPAATPPVATRPAAPQRETTIVAPRTTPTVAPMSDTDDAVKRRALQLVAEGRTRRDVAAELGVSKDKVQRWVTASRETLQRETVAV
ncbi:hypothetical protein BO226_19130 [Rhodococcus sp. 2G]|uniref:helix-turn-helix domain-containing protein n=1 Tax=Rhodococcus sp. 2G TaxID=1570939 RepID=UPI0009041E8B|nr:helix-turn-helix domain-containing protein [Rhodococcus sp. 2G]APE10993.1 hypothetical protein BO226_18795 [Rhodococcus sp. 2G]APE11051.1 hypothetical protein BO226_19130 [Rhodococcus sp. 2G]